MKRCCPTIRRRERVLKRVNWWGEPDLNRRGFLDRFTVCCFQPLSHRPHCITFIPGQLLGIEPRAVEPQSTILPLNYSCQTRGYPLPDLNRHSEEAAFKAAASTVSPSGPFSLFFEASAQLLESFSEYRPHELLAVI